MEGGRGREREKERQMEMETQKENGKKKKEGKGAEGKEDKEKSKKEKGREGRRRKKTEVEIKRHRKKREGKGGEEKRDRGRDKERARKKQERKGREGSRGTELGGASCSALGARTCRRGLQGVPLTFVLPFNPPAHQAGQLSEAAGVPGSVGMEFSLARGPDKHPCFQQASGRRRQPGAEAPPYCTWECSCSPGTRGPRAEGPGLASVSSPALTQALALTDLSPRPRAGPDSGVSSGWSPESRARVSGSSSGPGPCPSPQPLRLFSVPGAGPTFGRTELGGLPVPSPDLCRDPWEGAETRPPGNLWLGVGWGSTERDGVKPRWLPARPRTPRSLRLLLPNLSFLARQKGPGTASGA
ncbi:tetra-peptide repeat homeobox protein 1-like [Antechinus flavipes]|uniref:tetra-peptide repeat homeobox protein 1-like n=1 Tax=Antechinus flavipes TaxID=38775 RepID=UPI0022365392|nr:tetra-peptide repeat homeobox protein 1-like [Antechinus flavipes]XP_051844529.1 tetra-peptide repeat homeobox protein 1-like [Antechinus flavipes]XP_051844530.1 tetra-peptide repeat homeobox protein 1-like [Antechinus flavipes]XP_051844531.1 tetra-peptide repeat homeobox protein 1-like [Antechinus flavipes]XP_051844532.1 tetra-peptide repeat homeobox protein 1-like [Antechinus flavipes]XP_051844533.1 tetra-peptide repeat homeobox protein 1-like [Antechinus flavipes]XP_051844534.1 tetra-pe